MAAVSTDRRSWAQAHADLSGRRLVSEMLARYELAWALADVAVSRDLLRDSHARTEDTAWSWGALVETVEELASQP